MVNAYSIDIKNFGLWTIYMLVKEDTITQKLKSTQTDINEIAICFESNIPL